MSIADYFPEPVSVYTRAEAIDDGTLIDVTKTASEAGFRCPVAVTAALWGDIEAIPPSKKFQDTAARLWDVLYMGRLACRNAGNSPQMCYRLIMHVGRKSNYTVKAVIGPGDAGEMVITLMKPDED